VDAGVVARIARPVAALAAVDAAAGFVFGGLGVLTVIIAFDRLGSGEAGTGALNAAVGVGGVVGAVVSGILVLGRRLAGPLLLGAFTLALGVAVLGLTTSMPLALVAIAAASLGSLLLSVADTTLFQRIVPDAVRGRTLGIMETVGVLAYAVGSFALPALVQAVDIGVVLVASGAIIAVTGIVAVPLLGAHATQAPPADPVRATLSAVPIFGGLAPARLERAQRRAHVLEVPPGQVVIRQGDRADRFYVIVSGEVEVTQRPPDRPDGESRVLRRMGEREVFGEIGLLTGVPRTATVATTRPTTLLALDGPDFLELVGSGAGVTFPILDLHRGATRAAD
jgi:MFS family permease